MNNSVQENLQEINEKSLAIKPPIVFTDENNVEFRLLSKEDEDFMDTTLNNVLNYIANNDISKLSDEEAAPKIAEVKELWQNVGGRNGRLSQTKFKLPLRRDEFAMLTDLILKHMTYDVDTLFYAIELKTALGLMAKKSEEVKYKDSKEVITWDFTALDLTYLYHVLAKHTVKGLQKQAYTFADILMAIAKTSKVFDYYKSEVENAMKMVQQWMVVTDSPMESQEGVATAN